MNRLRANGSGCRHDLIAAQVRILGRCGADWDGFIRQSHVHGPRVHSGIDRHRANPQFLAGAHDPHSNFAAIRNQYFLKHADLMANVCNDRDA
jgi:hypothetical protein